MCDESQTYTVLLEKAVAEIKLEVTMADLGPDAWHCE